MKMNKEQKEVMADAAWWRSHLPTGWRLHSFSYRENAGFLSPSGRLVDIDGELLVAMRGQSPLPPSINVKDEDTFAILKQAGIPISASWSKCNHGN